ncbi:MAG: glycosyltransferase family 2 protein [Selenomonas artemidis]|nr:glycosyltransferase family 2 protein [Selenomonas artemidis]
MEQEQMRSLLNISVEAASHIQGVLARGEGEPALEEIVDNLAQIAAHIETATVDAAGLMQKVHLYAKNVQASVDDIRCGRTALECGVLWEIYPFVVEMQRLWHLATEVLSDASARAGHQERLMQAMKDLHGEPRTHYPYDVSIVLCAYNKLEYTKKAVESIFAHTDFSSGRIELITINNGSEDGTREYFERLPHRKKLNPRHNILGINSWQHIAEGKYIVGFSNDVVATPHWLEHLRTAMESDERIAMAVPTCNEESISNLQGIPVPYANTFEGMREMQEFAAAHNHLDPALWEERSVLMPFLAITRSDVYKLGLIDPIYTRGEFVDDDLSTLLRRTGWRQLLLKDTFVHHFGGVTLGAERHRGAGNALDEMRRVYYTKWGVDAWDSRGGFIGSENAWAWHTFHAGERVLVMEPRFGELACDLVNAYRRSGFVPHMTAAVFDERYLPDTNYIFDETMTTACIADVAAQCAGQRYDVITAGCYLDELSTTDVVADLERLYALLAPGGIIILPVRNPGSAYELDCMMHAGTRDVYEPKALRYAVIPYRQLLERLHAHPLLHQYRVHSILMKADEELVRRMKPLLRHDEDTPADLELSLSIRMFFLGISK